MLKDAELEPDQPSVIPIYQPEINGDKLKWNADKLSRFTKLVDLQTTIYIVENHQRIGQHPSEVTPLTKKEKEISSKLLQSVSEQRLSSKEFQTSNQLLREVLSPTQLAFIHINSNYESAQATISVNEAEVKDYINTNNFPNPDQQFIDILNSVVKKGLRQITFREKLRSIQEDLHYLEGDTIWSLVLTSGIAMCAAGVYLSWEFIQYCADKAQYSPVLASMGAMTGAVSTASFCLAGVGLSVGNLYVLHDSLLRPGDNVRTYPGKIGSALNNCKHFATGCVYLNTSGRELLSSQK